MRRDLEAQPGSGLNSRVAPGTRVKGQVSGAVGLQVDGEIEGKVVIENNVAIAPGGVVKGEIRARTVQVQGKVQGNVRGSERVEILAEGSLEGDVWSPRVVIAEGAFFKGNVEMGPEPAAAAEPEPREKTGV